MSQIKDYKNSYWLFILANFKDCACDHDELIMNGQQMSIVNSLSTSLHIYAAEDVSQNSSLTLTIETWCIFLRENDKGMPQPIKTK